jgi:exoribonuclease R
METLDGAFDFDGHFTYFRAGQPVYRIGDTVKVTCIKADVASGKVDFAIVDDKKIKLSVTKINW